MLTSNLFTTGSQPSEHLELLVSEGYATTSTEEITQEVPIFITSAATTTVNLYNFRQLLITKSYRKKHSFYHNFLYPLTLCQTLPANPQSDSSAKQTLTVHVFILCCIHVTYIYIFCVLE